MPELFSEVGIFESNSKWGAAIQRLTELPLRQFDIRSEFARDNNRILHCTAYRRLKHKTQVFFATSNDHICTRIEHVNHVASISQTISKQLGLNTELTNAIALGHDLGHAPFGHAGESILKKIAKDKLDEDFWHEKNSLRFIDDIETLEDFEGCHRNLNLTYAVRDGIICHCGEVDEKSLFPRPDPIDLKLIIRPNEYQPYTWEGCIVKISDKIAYLGRDIEDALALKVLTLSQKKELTRIAQSYGGSNIKDINNTLLIHDFIIDLCKHSSPEKGIKLSEKNIQLMNLIKSYNYNNIYKHKRLDIFKDYADLIINSFFNILYDKYSDVYHQIFEKLISDSIFYPTLIHNFIDWINKYEIHKPRGKDHHKKIYNFDYEKEYILAIIEYISGMTDNFAIRAFNELISYN